MIKFIEYFMDYKRIILIWVIVPEKSALFTQFTKGDANDLQLSLKIHLEINFEVMIGMVSDCSGLCCMLLNVITWPTKV